MPPTQILFCKVCNTSEWFHDKWHHVCRICNKHGHVDITCQSIEIKSHKCMTCFKFGHVEDNCRFYKMKNKSCSICIDPRCTLRAKFLDCC